MRCYYFFFFFQAEDGIRDKLVTGVQTCALPILDPVDNGALSSCPAGEGHTWGKVSVEAVEAGSGDVHTDGTAEVGRGAWRGRGEISGGAGSFKKKKEERKRKARCKN